MTINSISAYLPYYSEGRAEGLEIDVTGLERFTITVGRNASGKTSLLEALGYAAAITGYWRYTAQAMTMISTIRPYYKVPSLFAATIYYDKAYPEKHISLFMVEAIHPLILHNMFRELRRREIGRRTTPEIYDIVLRDVSRITRKIHKNNAHSESARRTSRIMPIRLETDKLFRILDTVFEKGYEITIFPWLRRRTEISSYPWISVKRFYLAYIIEQGKPVLHSMILDSIQGIIAATRATQSTPPTPRGILVFHPGFIFQKLLFETIYLDNIKHGLPREREAISLLRRFIPWFDGYELIGRRLHIRSIYGKRIDVYALSDGQRAAALLGLLYAASPDGSLIIVDTPEAFVHPDGLTTTAELIASMVAEGNQVFVATQSAEMLRSLLHAAEEAKVLGETSIKNLRLLRGRVEAKGSWRGMDALGIIEELALDLRRA